ncbi:glucose-6-phosphate dehydrogenase [Labrys monachus]|uniref:Glucose-6-phosphate 1-dehydrogenase n=1 Tax=Labrys monachus TaxID=217067 RepID=A0ABU0FDV7_9HYPH|nr:glucose-6-phosphate dehydrogenase [Labrys monachus]MDQ0392794.1 glucose-6-phosphate 1-dehydrogenase [Labrys monachus]
MANDNPTAPHDDSDAAPPTPAAPACTLVVFGAHGDLTRRLLTPSLYNLAGAGLLDDGFRIVGLDRVADTTEGWVGQLSDTMQDFTRNPNAEFYVPHIDGKVWSWLADRMTYQQADFTKPKDMAQLKTMLSGNVVFYLAVAARFFGTVVDQLGDAGLLAEAPDAFRRVIIEKPFGSDLDSAKKLNADILRRMNEAQVFRIDHFLGKETVQNIMALRFANGILEPLWRRDHIDYVEITAAETVGVEGRGAFYEPTGAMRDMVQNHLFQLLTMVAMEPPNSFEPEQVRNAKAQLLGAVQPIPLEDAVRGQYDGGAIAGINVPAYRDEPNVAPDSHTETYVAMKLTIENWRWAGVPFYIRTGKHLGARCTEVVVHFRPAPYALFKDTPVDRLAPNTLVLSLQPQQGLILGLNIKVPGTRMVLGGIALDFFYKDAFAAVPSVGYETLIYDCFTGDATLFQRADTIEASWALVDPILKAWAEDGKPLARYAAGTAGPSEADDLLIRDGHGWKPLSR